MPHMETPTELAEHLADLLGIYDADEDHEGECECRVCFVSGMTDRIRNAVANETILDLHNGGHKK